MHFCVSLQATLAFYTIVCECFDMTNLYMGDADGGPLFYLTQLCVVLWHPRYRQLTKQSSRSQIQHGME